MPKAPSFALNALQQPACPCPSAHMPPPIPWLCHRLLQRGVSQSGIVASSYSVEQGPHDQAPPSLVPLASHGGQSFSTQPPSLCGRRPRGGGGGLPPAFQSCGPDTWTAPRWPRSSPSVRTVRTACCRCWGGPPAYLRAVRQSYGMRLKLSRDFTGFGVADRLGVLTPSTTNVGQVPN